MTSNWCRCTSCHIGYGWKDENFDFNNPNNIDCLICHDTTGTYTKAPPGCGREKPGLDLLKIARNVGTPTRSNCGTCHWCGGGGDGIKHGDLDSTLKEPLKYQDVHMGGLDFNCQDCHQPTDHKIPGASTTCAVSEGNVSCTDCHDERPHSDDHPLHRKLNDHCKSIACQTCHIPRFARSKPTLMFWDWSLAGKGTFELEESPYNISEIHKKKGLLIKRKNVRPVYAWYNGKVRRYLAGDPVNINGITCLNPPVGDIRDPNSKIWPYKLYTAIQPADAEYKYLIIPKLWGGYWRHYDWDQAAKEGMKVAGLDYSGKLVFVKTTMYWRLNHEISPKEEALSCLDCHRDGGVMDFQALGYKGDPAITGSRFKKTNGQGPVDE